jgi:hypothetical protein
MDVGTSALFLGSTQDQALPAEALLKDGRDVSSLRGDVAVPG